MSYIDFAALKERIGIEDAIRLLSLDLKPRGESHRGPCPACRSGGDRALVVTPSKGAFYCFAARAGGDVIALVAHIRDCSMKEAAAFLAEETGGRSDPTDDGDSGASHSSRSTNPKERAAGAGEKGAAKSLQPLTYLDAEHEAVQALGLDPQTCEAFGCGYAPKGIMRGRLAIPIHDWRGRLVAYCGRAVKGESPTLTFPNGFDPARQIFNAHRIDGPELILVRDPLDALMAHQMGLIDTVSLLTETLSAEQLQMLAALMDEKGCESLEIH